MQCQCFITGSRLSATVKCSGQKSLCLWGLSVFCPVVLQETDKGQTGEVITVYNASIR